MLRDLPEPAHATTVSNRVVVRRSLERPALQLQRHGA